MPIGSFLVWMVVVVVAMIRASNASEPAPEPEQRRGQEELRGQLDEVRAEVADVRIRLEELSANPSAH